MESLVYDQSNSPPHEPVGIILGPGIEQIISQFAVLLAGGTCVPLEPSLPETRITDLLHDIDTKKIIIEKGSSYQSKDFEHVYVGETEPQESQPSTEAPSDLSKRAKPTTTRRTHILFTSGSTGKPKPVQITSAAIIHLATRTPATPLRRADRVAEFNNPGFDLSLFEIWATLLAGATIVPIPKRVVTDVKQLEAFLHDARNQVSVMFITAALIEVLVSVAPSVFRGLRHVLSGGDVAPVKAMRTVLDRGPPGRLWNTYGSTECVTLTTMREVTGEEVTGEEVTGEEVTGEEVTGEEVERGRIGIGSPLGDMEVYLVESENEDGDGLRVVTASGEVGEICIAGPQQTPGYLNEQGKNQQSFVTLERSRLRDCSRDGGERVRLYRTGDLAEWRAGGTELDFVGRIDNQVKHKGFRVHLGEIEKTLLTHEQVKSAVVVQRPSSSPLGQAALVAFMIPETNVSVDVSQVNEMLAESLPSHMVPSEFIVKDEFPLTLNGKFDRKELLNQHVAARDDPKRSEDTSPAEGKSNTNAKSEIKNLWKEILNAPSIEDDADFLALGATSLQSAKLITSIRKRLNDLLQLIDKYKTSKTEDIVDDSETWTRDMDLVNDIDVASEIESHPIPEWQGEDEGRVFTTGVTGFVGAFFLSHLLHNPRVKQVACLSHAKGSSPALQRIQEALERYDIWPDDPKLTNKIVPLEGDIAADKFDIGDQFTWLSTWASAIFHLGAKVNFTETYDQHFSANVIGTRNILALAAAGRPKPLFYMSTIDVWGGPAQYVLGTEKLYEEDPLEPHVQSVRFDLGYAQSQYTAEGMVRRMRAKGLSRAVSRWGKWPRLVQCFEYVCVDYIVEAAMHIASSNKNLGRSYHLLSPDRAISMTMEGTYGLINEAGYGPLESIDYWEWTEQASEKQRPEERVRGGETRWQVSQHTPLYDSSNALGAIRDRPDIRYKPLDAQILKRFIEFWNRKGFYDLKSRAA
ncbi:NRPS-like enzyme [Aspergillus karnatakaensis]|uniref:non-ribosomal peptide synthetase n=1 Tax=Aspergillus karnatakaensis TaxID=1810916 RepID=UPI003CCCC2B6